MSHSDATVVVCDVGGRLIREFSGLAGYRELQEASLNLGPGNVAFGFNTQKEANAVEFELRIRSTSPDRDYIRGLTGAQTIIQIMAYVPEDKLGPYEVGQEVGLGAERCIILPGEREIGVGEAADVSYRVIGIGPLSREKTAVA